MNIMNYTIMYNCIMVILIAFCSLQFAAIPFVFLIDALKNGKTFLRPFALVQAGCFVLLTDELWLHGCGEFAVFALRALCSHSVAHVGPFVLD